MLLSPWVGWGHKIDNHFCMRLHGKNRSMSQVSDVAHEPIVHFVRRWKTASLRVVQSSFFSYLFIQFYFLNPWDTHKIEFNPFHSNIYIYKKWVWMIKHILWHFEFGAVVLFFPFFFIRCFKNFSTNEKAYYKMYILCKDI
jgi:hypothetical protein